GRNGDDEIHGGKGNDFLTSDGTTSLGEGNDTFFGDSGDDSITDDHGRNVAKGGSGNDNMDVRGKAYGEAGDDIVVATETANQLMDGLADGGSGDDDVTVIGGTANGGSGYDDVTGTFEGDKLYGGSGSDFLDGSAGINKFLDCGSAYDYYLSNTGD